MSELYVGLMSGTSMDGVDAVLSDIGDSTCRVLNAHTTPFPTGLRQRLERLVTTPTPSLRDLGTLDRALGRFFAECALELMSRSAVGPKDVVAIGHHGQTVFHEPAGDEPFTMQIGDPNVVTAETGITTVADFRRLDMALGGQGAPLVPAFHAWCFGHATEHRAVVNIGGIANVTAIDPERPPTGFDTGPGNTLLDLWIRRCLDQPFDRDGEWSARGRVDQRLLARMLEEPYFGARAPKSTGRELFHLGWLEEQLRTAPAVEQADVQATLAELTATTIAAAIGEAIADCRRVIVCGGGAHNRDLLRRLEQRSGIPVETTAGYGIAPDWVEGAAFGWLARARLRTQAGNVPSVTGARRQAVLGAVYWGAPP